ncbi:MAG: hypothetical protein Q8O38_06400 [Sulfurimicrobium sp.]|nr:hypothetical protein [Sulfurimicrobium sp.]
MDKPDLIAFSTDLRKIGVEVEKLAAPIDFEALERDCLLEKVGAWYVVPNLDRLPDNARSKISGMKLERGRVLVKFKKVSEFDRIAKKFRKLGAI